jgi:hypothetical protein
MIKCAYGYVSALLEGRLTRIKRNCRSPPPDKDSPRYSLRVRTLDPGKSVSKLRTSRPNDAAQGTTITLSVPLKGDEGGGTAPPPTLPRALIYRVRVAISGPIGERTLSPPSVWLSSYRVLSRDPARIPPVPSAAPSSLAGLHSAGGGCRCRERGERRGRKNPANKQGFV